MKNRVNVIARGTDKYTPITTPLFASRTQAGFPSPADDSIEQALDLNRHIITHPAATFFVRAEGDSMEGAGIFSGDILVVDRSLEPKNGNIVIAAVYDELTVKRLQIKGKKVTLNPENSNYDPIEVTEEMESVIWGVVTHTVRTL